MKKVLLFTLLAVGAGEALAKQVVFVNPNIKGCVSRCHAANPPCKSVMCPDVVVDCTGTCQMNSRAY